MQSLPQPYRFKVAANVFKTKGGKLELDAPSGMPEAELDLLTAALEIFADTQPQDKKGGAK